VTLPGIVGDRRMTAGSASASVPHASDQRSSRITVGETDKARTRHNPMAIDIARSISEPEWQTARYRADALERIGGLGRPVNTQEEMMLTTILVILAILWLLGFSLHIGGGLIHVLLVVALVLLAVNLLSGRRLA
jgi:hypothetical protein